MGSVTAFIEDLVTLNRSNTANIFIKDQLRPLLDIVTDNQERELHRRNSRTERQSYKLSLRYLSLSPFFICWELTESRNRVVVDVYWNI